MNMFSLEGKIALVTGASYGIGFAIAKAMAKAGATICFNDLKQELVDRGLAAYEAEGIKAHGYVCNVCDEEGVTAAAYTVMLMCGAGMPPMEEMDFILDRPFLFVITSRDNLPLFAGVVNQV